MSEAINQGNVELSINENGIATITFSHPLSNSLPGKILAKLADTITEAGANDSVKIIILRSAGERAFCGGASFDELISIRIAIGSGVAFLVSQLFDVQIFDQLRQKEWFVAPLTSSLVGSTIDTFLFFSIAFYATGVPWLTLSLGDLAIKIFVALLMLIPFRLLLGTVKFTRS